MSFVLFDVFNRPTYAPFKGMMSNGTIVFDTNGAGGRETSIGMNEQLNRVAKSTSHFGCQFLDFLMRLVNIKIPRHGEVAIDVKGAAILDDPDVVNINPVLASLPVKHSDHFLK